MEKEVNLFVPGRLCLLGEHSDWAGQYRNINSKINKGYAIVTGVEEGIYATAKKSNTLKIKNIQTGKSFECEMDEEKLSQIASEGGYWSYIAGVAKVLKEQYDIGGVDIEMTNVTLPEKKGLSSSAAICVLVTRAFNQLYNLKLNTIGEMNIAYLGEIETPSRCGKLDQACAFGKVPVLLEFDGDKLRVKRIKVGKDLNFVFADLMSSKDTIKILSDLNKCFPYAKTQIGKDVQKGLGYINEENIKEAIKYIESGDIDSLGKLMIKAQQDFDTLVAPACKEELTSPVLHSVFENDFIKSNCLGYKGVGSQGDGTIQFLVEDLKKQKELVEYLRDTLKMEAYTLTISKTNLIKKAIIPLAGNGTRMYPMTKILKKAFLPIIDKDNILKPTIMCLLEELDEAGIEKICLVIDENDQKDYDEFFYKEVPEEIKRKLSKETLEYDAKIKRIGKKLEFVYQKEKLGLGHAVSLCKDFAASDDVLLVLGDQIYNSYTNDSVTRQLLNYYNTNNSLTIAVSEVDLNEVSKYGILSGTIEGNNNHFNVNKMYEKPEKGYAEEYLFTMKKNQKKYYSVFGEYILPPIVFELLERNIKEGNKEGGEYQITSVLDEARETCGMTAFIPEGEMLDVGNVNSYKHALVRKMR